MICVTKKKAIKISKQTLHSELCVMVVMLRFYKERTRELLLFSFCLQLLRCSGLLNQQII